MNDFWTTFLNRLFVIAGAIFGIMIGIGFTRPSGVLLLVGLVGELIILNVIRITIKY